MNETKRLTFGILTLYCLALITGCESKSPYKTEAERAMNVANSVAAAIQGGTVSYGDYSRFQRQLEDENRTLAASLHSTDSAEQASESSFEASWGVLSSSYGLLGTTKFEDEKLAKIGSGGISPAFVATIGSEEIEKMHEDVTSLAAAYAKLH